MVIEFRCLDCGRHVVSYHGEVGIAHCSSCAWITENVPPEHQADARERLGVPLAREA
jgi:transcription elongation factor Elf1